MSTPVQVQPPSSGRSDGRPSPAPPPASPRPSSLVTTNNTARASPTATNGSALADASGAAAASMPNPSSDGWIPGLPNAALIAIAVVATLVLFVVAFVVARRRREREQTVQEAQQLREPAAAKTHASPSVKSTTSLNRAAAAPTIPPVSALAAPAQAAVKQPLTQRQSIVSLPSHPPPSPPCAKSEEATRAKPSRASMNPAAAVTSTTNFAGTATSNAAQGIRRVQTSTQAGLPPPLAIVDEQGNVYALQQPLFPSGGAAARMSMAGSANGGLTMFGAAPAIGPYAYTNSSQIGMPNRASTISLNGYIPEKPQPVAAVPAAAFGAHPLHMARPPSLVPGSVISQTSWAPGGMVMMPGMYATPTSHRSSVGQHTRRVSGAASTMLAPVVEREVEGWRDEMGAPPPAPSVPSVTISQ